MKKEDINTVAEENIKDNINNGVDENVDSIEQTEQTEQTEETVEDNTAASTEDTAEEQVDPLEKALAEIEELKKQALYKQAEFENYRKRTIKEKADLILGGGEKTVTAILPVLDDFERALADKSEDPAAIREGMQLIYNKFVKTLEGLGVKKIETENADFNVDFHESIALVPGMGEDKKGKVIDCVQTGYTLNDKVIRFAKVAVGQ
ncbi:MAG: nucleotide exchange factor GrpE [Prevotella sp.]|nr:nucleotide exchange factor GrpE [Prevotella sp.]